MNGPDQFPHLLPMIAMAVAVVAESSPAFSQSLTFAAEPTGTLPKTFETAPTGQGQAGRWEVIEDASADDGRALAQLNSDPTDYRFPPAIPRRWQGWALDQGRQCHAFRQDRNQRAPVKGDHQT